MSIITGALLGLSTLLFIGPVFFYLLKSSLEDGFKAGFSVAVGIIVGDIICVLLALYGFGSFFEQQEIQRTFTGVGGLLLLLFGIKYLLKPRVNNLHTDKIKGNSLFKYFVNGFLINFVNPFVFAVWFGFYTLNTSKYETENEVMISLVTTLVVIFSTDILKALFAHKLSSVIKPKKLRIIFKVFGVIMIVFAVRLLFEFLKN